MTKLFCLALVLSGAHCWSENRNPIRRGRELGVHNKEQNPCWQDLYDDDCSMDAVYQASFVASQWLKSMPCAAGLEVSISFIHSISLIKFHCAYCLFSLQDCDMPEEWTLPGNRQEDFDSVDVMKYLNLKRAIPLVGSNKGESKGNLAP